MPVSKKRKNRKKSHTNVTLDRYKNEFSNALGFDFDMFKLGQSIIYYMILAYYRWQSEALIHKINILLMRRGDKPIKGIDFDSESFPVPEYFIEAWEKEDPLRKYPKAKVGDIKAVNEELKECLDEVDELNQLIKDFGEGAKLTSLFDANKSEQEIKRMVELFIAGLKFNQRQQDIINEDNLLDMIINNVEVDENIKNTDLYKKMMKVYESMKTGEEE